MRKKRTSDFVQEVQEAASNKNAGIVAKAISDKYKKWEVKGLFYLLT